MLDIHITERRESEVNRVAGITQGIERDTREYRRKEKLSRQLRCESNKLQGELLNKKVVVSQEL